VRGGGLLQGLLHGPAGGIVHMHDAAVRVPALARQVPALIAVLAGVERHAQRRQPVDGGGGMLHHKFHGGAVVQPGAGHHRVLDMAFKRVPWLQHGSDPALRPGSGAGAEVPLRQHRHLEAGGKIERRCQPGSAGADHDHVMRIGIMVRALGHQAQTTERVSSRNTSSRSASLVETSTTPSPAAATAASTLPALVVRLS